MKSFICMIVLIASSGCASKHMRGSEAVAIGENPIANLKVTAAVAKDLSLDQYLLVDVYLQNLNSDWLRAKSIEIQDVEGAERFRVILAQDLKTWRKSVALDFDLRLEQAKLAGLRHQLVTQKAQLKDYDDEDHLYRPFSVPAQLQTRKWVLFQFDDKAAIKRFKMTVTWIDDRRQVFSVPIVKDTP